jgi:hypothetical protein
MYVRWKKRALRKQVHTGKYQRKVSAKGNRYIAAIRKSQPTGDYALSAQLVESRRIDGKPRQHVIKYLGTIDSHRIQDVGPRMFFWRHVGTALKALALPPEQQRPIELALHERVPFPTKEEIEAEREHFRQLEERIRQQM